MARASFSRPDGRPGSYRDWLAEVAAKWNALTAAEQAASRDAAVARLAARISASADGPAVMHLYDEIGYFGVWPADVVAALSDIRGDVEVHVNSPGGSVFDGLAIYAALKDHRGDVGVVVDGLAASAASFIAMAAAPGRLEIQPNGTMMIHEAWGACVGSEADMRATADVLADQTANIAGIYADRGGRTAAEYRELMAAETWAVGQRAVDLGLADRVRKSDAGGSGSGLAVAAAVPWQVTILAAAPSLAEQHGHPGQECVDPDGDGDCDLTPEGDTDHDYWTESGTMIKPLPGQMRGGRDVRNDVDSSEWDASKAWHNGAASDDPAAFYKGICAGKKSGDPATQAGWALPYRYTPSSAPNAAGVRNALSRLPQTEGLTNKAEAQALLERLMKQVNPDYEPDDRIEPGLLSAALLDALKG